MVSHYLEMMAPAGVVHAFHGEQIGVAAIASARVQAAVLAREAPPRVRPSALTRDDIVAHFGEALGDACWREVSGKLVDAVRADAINARMEARWDAIRARIARVATTGERIAALLGAAGAPRTAAELGYGEELWRDALAYARVTRDRYTFFDLAADLVE
jgi:glycerol-1-phosphate dehydrogenase [NAD(P)+]